MTILPACQRCGELIVARRRDRKWCDRCKPCILKEAERRYRNKNREKIRARSLRPPVLACKRCAAPIEPKPARKWCEECRRYLALEATRRYRARNLDRVRARDREQQHRRRTENGEYMRAQERRRRAEHRGEINARVRQQRIENGEYVRERDRRYKAKYRERTNARVRRHRAKNLEQIRARERRYWAENHEVIRTRNRLWWAKNREKMNAWTRQYRVKNRKRVKKISRQWYAKNRERIRTCARQRYANNRERIRALHRANMTFKKALEDFFDPTAAQRQRTGNERFHDRQAIYRAVLEEIGPGILTVLDELKAEELKQLESKGDES